MRPREAWRRPAAESLRIIASSCEAMADALDADDDILGAVAKIPHQGDYEPPEIDDWRPGDNRPSYPASEPRVSMEVEEEDLLMWPQTASNQESKP